MTSDSKLRSGYVTIIGRPNVGKSTLLNHCLNVKLSITSRKPQTTRHQLLGILTQGDAQYLFLDTPGIHLHKHAKARHLNRYMNRQALSTIQGVDVVLFLVESSGIKSADLKVLNYLEDIDIPVICVLTKIDRVHNKNELLPQIEDIAARYEFKAIVPVSALQNDGIEELLTVIKEEMPHAPHLYGIDDITDKPKVFLIGELIREQVVRQLGAELPHRSTVYVENIEEEETLTTIDAQICVERVSQKRIVIGKQGQRIKSIGERARQQITEWLEGPVRLNLHVRVRAGWTDDQRTLKQLGY